MYLSHYVSMRLRILYLHVGSAPLGSRIFISTLVPIADSCFSQRRCVCRRRSCTAGFAKCDRRGCARPTHAARRNGAGKPYTRMQHHAPN